MKLNSLYAVDAIALFILFGAFMIGCGGVQSGNMEMNETTRQQIDILVKSYINTNKHWNENDYKIGYEGRKNGDYIIQVSHKDDEEQKFPGGGKSVILYVDLPNKKVIKELAFQ